MFRMHIGYTIKDLPHEANTSFFRQDKFIFDNPVKQFPTRNAKN